MYYISNSSVLQSARCEKQCIILEEVWVRKKNWNKKRKSLQEAKNMYIYHRELNVRLRWTQIVQK